MRNFALRANQTNMDRIANKSHFDGMGGVIQNMQNIGAH